jgi:hypothetical protein
MNAGAGSVAVIALVIGGWLWWHRDAPRTTTACFLVAGLGFGGALGNLIATALSRAFAPGAAVSGWGSVLLAALVAAAFVATFEVFVKGIGTTRRKAKPRRWHPWLALALPTILVATFTHLGPG